MLFANGSERAALDIQESQIDNLLARVSKHRQVIKKAGEEGRVGRGRDRAEIQLQGCGRPRPGSVERDDTLQVVDASFAS